MFARNFDTPQPIFLIFGRRTLQKFEKPNDPPNSFSVTALPRKILIAILVMFSPLKRHCFLWAMSLSIFIRISQFLK